MVKKVMTNSKSEPEQQYKSRVFCVIILGPWEA